MGKLNDLGIKYDADKSSRFHNYLDFYEKVLPPRSFKGRLLEVGVMDGASMKMWREYYPDAEIVGVDIKDMSFMHNDDWQIPESVKLVTADATKPADMAKLGVFDVIIDDGGHYMSQQKKSCEILCYNNLNKGGLYILEDLWTSYIDYYQDSKPTTMEYLKKLEQKGMKMTYFKHKHAKIQQVFPKYKGLAELGSITVAIKAGQ